MLAIDKTDFTLHRSPRATSDRIALGLVGLARACARLIFGARYGHRAVVTETIAAVPGMVAATLLHLKCLRRMSDDGGWVRALMSEAENQRAHLMVFVETSRPGLGDRLLVLLAQGVFYNAYFALYLLSPATAHRLSAYMAEEALRGYNDYAREIASGERENRPAPRIARAYWNLPEGARMDEVIRAISEDEALHRDINHALADALARGRDLPEAGRLASL